jgi:hypothetical protein
MIIRDPIKATADAARDIWRELVLVVIMALDGYCIVQYGPESIYAIGCILLALVWAALAVVEAE